MRIKHYPVLDKALILVLVAIVIMLFIYNISIKHFE